MSNLEKYKNALSPLAFQAEKTQGRKITAQNQDELYDDDIPLFNCMNPFKVDLIKLVNSKDYRRLSYKTQVFPVPSNPHIRTRIQHTIEVMALAVSAAKILGLNSDLCQAIAFGHDIGHAPFGHFGENFITKNSGKLFRHNINGVVVAQEIERKGGGLNLSFETLLGILLHSRTNDKDLTFTPDVAEEYNLIMLADKIAFVFSDYNDAKRFGLIKEPNDSKVKIFGLRQRARVICCLEALAQESAEKGHLSFFDSEIAQSFTAFRNWLYDNVYAKIDFSLQERMLDQVINYLSAEKFFADCDPFLVLSLLTDIEVFQFADLCKSGRQPNLAEISNFGIMEITPFLRGKNIDFAQANLSWVKKII